MSTLAELTAALIAKEGRDYIAEFTAWANKVLTDLTDFQTSLMTAVQASSSTSLTLQVGEQTATIEAGKKFVAGNRITIATDATHVMAANVVSYTGTTLVFNVLDVSDVTGTYTGTGPWTISLAGDEGLPGDVDYGQAALQAQVFN